MTLKLHGLVAATLTPFNADGSLNLNAIEKQAEYLLRTGVDKVFVCGTTGESHSLQLNERQAVASRWCEIGKGAGIKVVVHVGANCIADSKALAAHAQQIGAVAVAALAPSYFKPQNVDTLIRCCGEIAGASPGLPFYYYDIPSMSGVTFSAAEFLEKGTRLISNLAGIKFTNPDLKVYQHCLRFENGRFDIPFGIDEFLLGALAMGAQGGVGSSYNYGGKIYNRLIAAFNKGDLTTARTEQYRSVMMIDALASVGYLGAAKAVMGMLGVDVGPTRLPLGNPTAEQASALKNRLEMLGFFDWIR